MNWTEYAMKRGRVRSIATGKVGNLVDWLPGKYCKVFVGWDKELAGYVKAPVFETWLKNVTVGEPNSSEVGTVRIPDPFKSWASI